MDKVVKNPDSVIVERITSVDFFRGLTMFLLIIENTRLINQFRSVKGSSILQFIATQFNHHQWHGLHMWDLIQPAFMFIVGVAIPFAVTNRIKKGDSNRTITLHALKRALLLLLFGWGLACVGSGQIVLRFQNVLAQLSVTYLVAFLIMKKSFKFQLIFTLLVLLLIDLAYRFFPVEGFNHPWVNYQNLGAWVNNKIEGVDKASTWATLNCVSTTCHTVWGVMCGKLLMSDKPAAKKIQLLLIGGGAALFIGYALDPSMLLGASHETFYITPIIKKIATSSFVFASGGWVILALCFSYWLIDIKKSFITGSKIFIIVGMNCIFIYLFDQLGGAAIVMKIFTPITKALFSWGGDLTVGIIQGLAVYASLWYICYWLYKNRLFIKI
jgi:predicted acyltransferase